MTVVELYDILGNLIDGGMGDYGVMATDRVFTSDVENVVIGEENQEIEL